MAGLTGMSSLGGGKGKGSFMPRGPPKGKGWKDSWKDGGSSKGGAGLQSSMGPAGGAGMMSGGGAGGLLPPGPAGGGDDMMKQMQAQMMKQQMQAMAGGMDPKTWEDELVKQMQALSTSLGDSPVSQMIQQQFDAIKSNPMLMQANIMGANMMVQQFTMMCGGDAKAMQDNFTKQAAMMFSSSPELKEVQDTILSQLQTLASSYTSPVKPSPPLPGVSFPAVDAGPKPAEPAAAPAGGKGGRGGGQDSQAAALQSAMGKKGRENRTTVFIGGLRKTTEEDRVHAHFAKYGEVEHVDIKRTPDGTSRGFAFVRFKDEESVERVIEAHAKHMIDNKWVEVRRRDSVAACAGRAATLAKEAEAAQEAAAPPVAPTAPSAEGAQDSKAAAEDWSQQYLTAAQQIGMVQQAQTEMMKAMQSQQNNSQGMMMGMPGMMGMGMMMPGGMMAMGPGGMPMMGAMDPKAMGMDPSAMMGMQALPAAERAPSSSSSSRSQASASRSRSPHHAPMDRRSRSRDRRDADGKAPPPPMGGADASTQPPPPPGGMQFTQPPRPSFELPDPSSQQKKAEAAAAAAAVASLATRAAEAAKMAAKEAADRPAPAPAPPRRMDAGAERKEPVHMKEFLQGTPGAAASIERRGQKQLWLPEAASTPAAPPKPRSPSRKNKRASPSPARRKHRGGGWDKEQAPPSSGAPLAPPSRPALPPGARPSGPPSSAVTYGVKSAGDRHNTASADVLQAAITRAAQVEAEGRRIMLETGVIPRGPPDLPTGTEVIEQKYVAYLIGKGGQALAAINSAAGVHIHIDQSTKASGYCMANIYGNEEGTLKAKCILAQKISEYRPPRSF